MTPYLEIILSARALVPLLVFLAFILKFVLKQHFPHISFEGVLLHTSRKVEDEEKSEEGKNRRKSNNKGSFRSYKYHEANDEDNGELPGDDLEFELEDLDDVNLDGKEEDEENRGMSPERHDTEEEQVHEKSASMETEMEEEKAEEVLQNGSDENIGSGHNVLCFYLFLALVGLVLFNIGLTKGSPRS